MTNSEKGFSFLHHRDEGKEPVVLLRDSKHIKEDMREVLKNSTEDEVKFGVEPSVFEAALSRITSPIPGIRVRNLNAEITQRQENDNRLKLSGKVTPIFVDKGLEFSITVVNKEDKLKVTDKSLSLSFLSARKQHQINELFNGLDTIGKEKINKKIEPLGEVVNFHIGNKLLEWNVKKTKKPTQQ